MIIKRLTLHNFGVYASTNSFEFNSTKPVVLIGGMNGRGKTTFLEAVLLALYGASSFAYTESRYQTYGQYLRAYVNEADGTLESYVELEFKMSPSDDHETYVVHRAWSSTGQRTREKINVKKDGEDNSFLTDNWSMFIENVLPSGLSNFFFFDGEKIAELAVESTNAQMKESIKSLLGISVLDLLQSDVSRIVNRVSKKAADQLNAQELELLRERENQTSSNLRAIDDVIAEIGGKIELIKRKIEKAKVEYSVKGGDIIAQKQDLFRQRSFLTARLEQTEEKLLEMVASDLPLIMVKPLIDQIMVQATKEHDEKTLQVALKKIDTMFQEYIEEYKQQTDNIKHFISYVKQQSEHDKPEMIYHLSDQALYQCTSMSNGQLKVAVAAAQKMLQIKEHDQNQADEIDSYLSVDIDESSLNRIYKKIKTCEQELMDLEVSSKDQQKKRTVLNGENIKATAEFNRFVESTLETLESNDENDRILRYSHQINAILDKYKISLQTNKIGVLAATMTECYKKLANKKNLIERIEMDAVTLDFKYMNADGLEVPKDSLSAGEKQLMVISMLWALAICSKKKLPVIIDTPLSRLDSVHRVGLIETYFPHASDQTIILSTDSEIDERYYNVIKSNVGDEFTLVYDDKKKCSTIQRGYFIGDMR